MRRSSQKKPSFIIPATGQPAFHQHQQRQSFPCPQNHHPPPRPNAAVIPSVRPSHHKLMSTALYCGSNGYRASKNAYRTPTLLLRSSASSNSKCLSFRFPKTRGTACGAVRRQDDASRCLLVRRQTAGIRSFPCSHLSHRDKNAVLSSVDPNANAPFLSHSHSFALLRR